jgi:hypothetical protein
MRFGILLLASAALAGAAPALAQDTAEAYPRLDAKQLGHLRNIVALADQPGFDTMEPGPRGTFEKYQFQIAWMYYALAVAQTQQTPAYRELYRRTSDQLIQKMMRPEVWNFWFEVIEDPKFAKYLDKAKDWRDPVREKNIMYSGHLLQMVGLYQRLYDERKYEKMGSISFKIDGPNGFKHDYSFGSLAKNIRDQFIASDFAGVDCEPNFVFAECNQHPVLGLMDHDAIHGTKLADLKSAFWDRAEQLGFLNKTTSRFAGPYLMQEKITGRATTAWNDGWTGVTLHAWQRDLVERVYPTQRDAEFGKIIDQTPVNWRARWASPSVSTDFGFLTAYAAELSDQPTKQALFDYADKNFRPVSRDGRYYYPRRDIEVRTQAMQITGTESVGPRPKPPTEPLREDQMGDHFVGPLMGNGLMAFARLNPGRGLWNMYNNLGATYRHGDPELVRVSYPQVIVTQAYYDAGKKRLAVAFQPGSDARGSTAFAIRNLSKSRNYVVTFDGTVAARVDGGRVAALNPALKVAWDKSGHLAIGAELRAEHSLVIDQVSAERTAMSGSKLGQRIAAVGARDAE